MAFSVLAWLDKFGSGGAHEAPSADPADNTPLDATAMRDLETRLSAYTDTTVTAHTADASAAHAASAISVIPSGTIAATDVGAALTEVAGDAATALTSGLAGKASTSHTHTVADLGTGTPASGKYLDGAGAWTLLPAQSGSQVSFTPAGSISATNVQAAIEEVASEASAGATEFATGGGLTLSGTHTTTLGAETWRTTIGTLTANHVETIAGRAAGKFVFLRVLQDGTGSRSLSVSDGSTSQGVTINSTAGTPTDILIVCKDATDFDVIVLGGTSTETDPLAILKTLLDAAGDLIYASADNTPARLAFVANGKVLTGVGGLPAWADPDVTQAELDAHAADTTSVHGIADTTLVALRPTYTTKTADYTFALGDAWNKVYLTGATGRAFTVPTNATVAFAVGTEIEVGELGAGVLTIAAAGGVTIDKRADKTLVLGGAGSVATLLKTATNTWLLTGELVAA